MHLRELQTEKGGERIKYGIKLVEIVTLLVRRAPAFVLNTRGSAGVRTCTAQ